MKDYVKNNAVNRFGFKETEPGNEALLCYLNISLAWLDKKKFFINYFSSRIPQIQNLLLLLQISFVDLSNEPNCHQSFFQKLL